MSHAVYGISRNVITVKTRMKTDSEADVISMFLHPKPMNKKIHIKVT